EGSCAGRMREERQWQRPVGPKRAPTTNRPPRPPRQSEQNICWPSYRASSRLLLAAPRLLQIKLLRIALFTFGFLPGLAQRSHERDEAYCKRGSALAVVHKLQHLTLRTAKGADHIDTDEIGPGRAFQHGDPLGVPKQGAKSILRLNISIERPQRFCGDLNLF